MNFKKSKNFLKQFFVLGIIAIISAPNSMAQIKDFGAWANLNVEKKINQTWAVEFSNSLRFSDNLTQLGHLNQSLGLDYNFNKNFRLSLNYRLIHEHDDYYEYERLHRFYVDFRAKTKLSKLPLNLTTRLRFQQEVDKVFNMDYRNEEKYHLRTKFTVTYTGLKKIRPFAFYEPYLPLFSENPRVFDKHRFAFGSEYRFNNQHSIEAFAMFKRRFGKRKTYDDYIVGLGYNFSF